MATESVDDFFREFERYRGFRPIYQVDTDRFGIAHIRISRFPEITISPKGRCDMPTVPSFPEGKDYAPAVALGWPSGRGKAAEIACIFADFFDRRSSREKPPYFMYTPAEWLRKHAGKSKPGDQDALASISTIGKPELLKDPSSTHKRGEACAHLAAVLRPLAELHHDKLDELKQEARELQRPDFVWNSLVESMSSMGNSRGYDGLYVNSDLHKAITYEALSGLPGADRLRVLARTLRAATVRMPDQKADWLADNFDRITKMGGPLAVKEELLKQPGRDAKVRFLEQFDGIGPKYARNIFMNVYHSEFHDCIAVDERIKSISKELGLSFRNYSDEENFYLEAAARAGLSGWELDRILYWFRDEVAAKLRAASERVPHLQKEKGKAAY